MRDATSRTRPRDALSRVRLRAEEVVENLEVRRLGVAAGVLIAVLAVFGAIELQYEPGGVIHRLFEFGGERNATAAFSTLLLLCAAAMAYLLSYSNDLEASRWRSLAGLYVFIGFDEAFWIHEYLQLWTGVDWQLLYVPVAAIAGVIYLRALPLVWANRVTRTMFIAASCAWLWVWVMEAVRRGHFFWIGPSEEIAEMLGSALFGLALLVLFQARRTPARSLPGVEQSPTGVSRTPAGIGAAEAPPLVFSKEASD